MESTRKKMKTPVRILLLVVLALAVAVSGFGIYFAVSGGFRPAEPSVDLVKAEADFRAQMADSSVQEVTLPADLVLTSPVEVSGNKVITGEGSLTASKEMAGKYLITVSDGIRLTLKGDITLDAAGISGGVYVAIKGSFTLEGNATVANAAEGTANVMAEGKVQMAGGTLTGGYNNVVLTKGAELAWTAGTNSASIRSGIIVPEGAKLSITGKEATLTGSGLHGIELMGTAVIENGTLSASYDTMIKVAPTGSLAYKGGNMTEAGYHGIESAGTVTVTGGFINKSYNSGIVNTGTLTVTGGTIMNSRNKGIMNKLNGQATVGGDAMLSTNQFAISNEDNAYLELSSASVMASTGTNVYAYGGRVYIHDIELSASGSNNVRVVAATVTMNNVIVAGNTASGSSTTHGILLEGGKVDATDVTIHGTKGNGIRNKGGEFTGKNITVQNSANHAVSNRNQDVTDRLGIVTIDNLVVESIRYNNILVEGGITTLTNSVLNQSGTNNIKISDGTVNLNNVQVLGNVEDAADNVHGIYMTGGELNATNIHVENTRGAAFRVNGETVKVNVNGVTTDKMGMYGVSVSVGDVRFENATFGPSKSNNLRLDAGSMELVNVDIQGHYADSASNVHAVYITGGVVTAKDLDIQNPTGAGLRNNGGQLNVENVTISGVGTHNLYLSGSNSVTNITGAVLGKTSTNNIALHEGVLNLKDVKVEGNTEGSATNVHGILANYGTLNAENVTISGVSGSGIRNKGAQIVAKDLTIDNFGGYNAISNVMNDDGIKYGNVSVENLTVTNGFNDGTDLVLLSNDCPGSMTIVNAKLDSNTENSVAKASVYVHQGNVTLRNVEAAMTHSNNIRVDAGVLTMDNVTIPGHVEGSPANVHGIYVPGGEVNASNITISGSTGSGLRVTEGKVTVENITIENVGTHTLYISGGETVLTNATMGQTGTNNVTLHDGKLTLVNSQVLGQVETAPNDAHAIFVYGGELTMDTVSVTGTTGSALRVRDGVVNAKNLKTENIGASAVVVNGGETVIDGLVTAQIGTNNINSWGEGKLEISNAQLCATKTHNVNVSGGDVVLKNATINGHMEGSANNVHAVYATGGSVTLSDSTILNPTGDGLRVDAAKDDDGKIKSTGTIVGANVTVSGAGRYGAWVSYGSLSVVGGTFTGLKSNSNNVMVSGGSASLVDVTLDTVNKNNNITINGGELKLHDVTVLGNDTTDTGCHNIYANGEGKIVATGYLKLMNAAGAGIRLTDNAAMSATDVTITDAGAYGIRVTGKAELTVDGLDISGTKTNNLLMEGGNVTLKNAVLNETKNNNIKLISGYLTLESVEVLGHVEGAKTDVHGIFLEGNGVLDAKDILIANTAGQALRVKGSEATVDGLILRNIGSTTLTSNTMFKENPGKLTINRLGLSSGCEHAKYGVYSDSQGNQVKLSNSILSVSKNGVGVYVGAGEAELDNVKISGGLYNVQNFASVTVKNSSLFNSAWSLRNEIGAKATLIDSYFYGNKEGTLPSNIYNGGELTIRNITVGYNRSGKGTSGVLYQAASASPIVLNGSQMGLHTPSKPVLLAAEEWVKVWGVRVPIVICDSVADAKDVAPSFKQGKTDPYLYISQRDNHLELTTQGADAIQPGGNYIIKIGAVRFESFQEAFSYIAQNAQFDTTGDYKKAATIQVIDSYAHFENVEIPEGFHITLIDDGDALRVIQNNTDGDMFTVGKNAKLTIGSTNGKTPVSGLTFDGANKAEAAIIHVGGGHVVFQSELTLSNAVYAIRMNGGKLDVVGGYAVNATNVSNAVLALEGTVNDLHIVGTKGNAIYMADEQADVTINNLTIEGCTTGILATNGKLTIHGLTCDAKSSNVLAGTNSASTKSNAVVTINGYADNSASQLLRAGSNSVAAYYGATVNLNNVEILGHDENLTTNIHGVIISGGTVNMDQVVIENTIKAGIRLNAVGSVLNAGNTVVRNTGTLAISLGTGKVTLTDGVTLQNIASSAIQVEGKGELYVTGELTMHTVGNRGITVNAGGILDASAAAKVTIIDAAGIGLETAGNVSIRNLTVDTTLSNAVHAHNIKVVAGNLALTGETKLGQSNSNNFRVEAGASAELSGIVAIGGTDSNNAMVVNGVVTLTENTNLRISGAKNHGIYFENGAGCFEAETGSVISVENVGISAILVQGEQAAFTAAAGTELRVNGAKGNTIYVSGGAVKLDKVTLSGGSDNAIVTENTIVTNGNGVETNRFAPELIINELNVSDWAASGKYLIHQKSDGTTVINGGQWNVGEGKAFGYAVNAESGVLQIAKVTVGKTSGNAIANYGAALDLADVTVLGHTAETTANVHGIILSGGVTTMDRVTVSGTSKSGVRINNAGAVVVANDLTVLDAKEHGISVSNGSLTLSGTTTLGDKDDTNGTIAQNGIYINGGTIQATGEVITYNTVKHGVLIYRERDDRATSVNFENLTIDGITGNFDSLANGGGTLTIGKYTAKNGARAALAHVNRNANAVVVVDGVDYFVLADGTTVKTSEYKQATHGEIKQATYSGDVIIGELDVSQWAASGMTGLYLTADGKTVTAAGEHIDLGGHTVINSAKINTADQSVNEMFTYGVGMYGGKLELNNAEFGTTKKNTVSIEGGSATLSGVKLNGTVDTCATLYIKKGASLVGVDLTIDKGQSPALANYGTADITNLTITNTALNHAIMNEGAEAVLTLRGAYLGASSSRNFALKGGTVNLYDVVVMDAKGGSNDAFCFYSSTELNIYGELTVQNYTGDGMEITAAAADTKINVYGSVSVRNVTGKGLYVLGGSFKVYDQGKLTISDATGNGIEVNGNVNFTVETGAQLSISDVGGVGLYTTGGAVTSVENVAISNTAKYGIQLGKGTFVGKNITVDGSKNENGSVGAGADANGTFENLVITNGTAPNDIDMWTSAKILVKNSVLTKPIRVKGTESQLRVAQSVQASAVFFDKTNLNVIGTLSADSKLVLAWDSVSHIPDDRVAVEFLTAEGQKDAAAWADCKENLSKIALADTTGAAYELFYHETDATVWLAPKFVTNETDLAIFLQIAQLKGEKNVVVPIAGSFEVASQVDLDDSFDSVTFRPYDTGDYTITYTGSNAGLFAMDDSDKLILENLGLAATKAVLLNQNGGELVIDGCTISGTTNNFVQAAGTATVKDTTFNKTSSNNLKTSGTLIMEGENTIHAHTERDANNVHGLYITKGNVTIGGVLNIDSSLGEGIQIAGGAEVTVNGTVNVNGGGRNGVMLCGSSRLTLHGVLNIANTKGPALNIAGWGAADDASTVTVKAGGKLTIGDGVANIGIKTQGASCLDVQTGAEVVVSGTTGHGVELTATSNITVSGKLTIRNVNSTNVHGISMASGTLKVYGEIEIDGVTGGGYGVNIAGSSVVSSVKDGALVQTGKLTIQNVGYGIAIHNSAVVELAELVCNDNSKSCLYVDGASNQVTVHKASLGGGTTVAETSVNIKNGNVIVKNATLNKTKNANVNVADGTLTLHDVVIKGSNNGNGISVGKNATLKGGNITIESTKGIGLSNAGATDVSNLVITGTASHAIMNDGATASLTVNGATIGGSAGNNRLIALKNGSATTLKGNVTIDASGAKSNDAICFYGGNATLNVAGNVVIRNISNHGINLNGAHASTPGKNDKVNITGTLTIEKVTGSAVLLDAENSAVTVAQGGKLIINETGKNGIEMSKGTLTVDGELSIHNATGNGINLTGGTANLNGTVEIDTCKTYVSEEETLGGNGVSLSGGTLKVAGKLSVKNAAANGINQTGGEILLTGSVDMNTIGGVGLKVTAGGINSAYDSAKDALAGELTIQNVTSNAVNINGSNLKVNINTMTIDTVGTTGTTKDAFYINNSTGNFGTVTIKNGTKAGVASNGTSNLTIAQLLISEQQVAGQTAMWLNASGKTAIGSGKINVAADGTTVDQPFANTIYVANGTVTLNNVTMGKTAKINVDLASGTTTLNHVTVKGTSSNNYAVRVQANATLKGDGLEIYDVAGSGFYSKGMVDLKNLVIDRVNLNHTTVIEGGTLTVENATFGKSTSTNIAVKGGVVNFKGNVVINKNGVANHGIQHYSAATTNIYGKLTINDPAGNGIYIQAGTLNLMSGAELIIDKANYGVQAEKTGAVICAADSTIRVTASNYPIVAHGNSNFTIGKLVTSGNAKSNVYVDTTGSVTINEAQLTGGSYGFELRKGTLNLNNTSFDKTANVVATGSNKVLNMSGLIKGSILFNEAIPANVTGELTEGSNVTVDWAAGKAPADGIVINFADGTMEASRQYIHLGSVQGASYLLHFTTEGGAEVGKLVDNVVTSEAELKEYLAAATYYGITEPTILIGDSFAVTGQVAIPAGFTSLTITDDGDTATTNTITYNGSESSIFAWGNCKTLTLNGVTIDGNKKGDLDVPKGVTLNLTNVTIRTPKTRGVQFSGAVHMSGTITVDNAGGNTGAWAVSGADNGVLTCDAGTVLNIHNTQYGFVANGTAVMTMDTVVIKDIGNDAIYKNGAGTMTIGTAIVEKSATAKSARYGVYMLNGKLTVDNLTIRDTNSVCIYQTGGTSEFSNVTIQDHANSHSIKMTVGTMTIRGGTIGKSNSNNVRTEGTSVLNLFGDVTVNGTNSNNAFCITANSKLNIGSAEEACNLTVNHANQAAIAVNHDTTGKASVISAAGSTVTVNTSTYGIHAASEAKVQLANLVTNGVTGKSIYATGKADVTIQSGTFGTTQGAMNIETRESAKLSLSNATVVSTSTVTWAHGNDKINAPVHIYSSGDTYLDNVTITGGIFGIRVHTCKNMTLNNVEIQNATSHGIFLQSSPVVKVTGTLKISNTGSRGIQVNSGTLDGSGADKIEIIDPGAVGIENGGTVTTNNLSVTTTKENPTYSHNIKSSGKTTLNGTTVLGRTTTNNVRIDKGTLNLNGVVTIQGTNTNNGVASSGTVNVSGEVTIRNVAGEGIVIWEGGALNVAGKLVSGIRFDAAIALNVTGELTEGSNVTVDWAAGKAPANGIAINFAEGTMDSSKAFVKLGSVQGASYLLYFTTEGGAEVGKLVDNVVTSEADLKEYLAAATYYGITEPTILIGDSFAVTGQVAIPAGFASLTITDDGTARTISRDASFTSGAFFVVPAGQTLNLTGTGTKDAPNLIFSGANVSTGSTMISANGSVVLNCVKFEKVTRSSGDGGVLWASNASITITDCTFEGNSTGVGGGALKTVKGTATITGTTFRNNTAKSYGGAYFCEGGTVKIDDCVFAGNSDSTGNGNGGGAIICWNNCSMTVTDTEFQGNHSDKGGAVHIASNGANITVSFENCIFTGNGSTGLGGAIMADGAYTVNVLDSTFNGNAAGSHGGGLYIGTQAIINVKDTAFESNSATTYGGAIYAVDKGVGFGVEGATFTSNSAKAGGAICSFAALTIKDSAFTTNKASNTGGDGGAIWCNKSKTISNTSFEGNSGRTGGAVYSEGVLIVTDCTFASNVSQGSGGAIRHSGKVALTIQDTDFIGNKNQGTYATDKDQLNNGGGAIMMQGSPVNPTITGGKFENNYSASNGGAIQLNSAGGKLVITNVAFTGNEAGVNGGAMHNKAVAELNNCTFTGNAAASGAAIHKTSGTTTAIGCTFAEGQSCVNVTIK